MTTPNLTSMRPKTGTESSTTTTKRRVAPIRADAPHGYGRYSRGCRCDICKAAKAEYMRRKRRRATATARIHTIGSDGTTGSQITRATALQPGAIRYIAFGVTHGTRSAYEERGCRCPACTRISSAYDVARRSPKPSGGDAA